ncbi:MAG: plasmid recombination protein [Paramuribaculum sp.]|nr:plasmid recombination protein [Paramuribaculum sp.]
MTQYAVCHLERGSGNDAGMSCHIERRTAEGKRYTPENVDASRTRLNCELIDYPIGVSNRSGAIQYRLDNANIQRKISKNQTRAVRVMLTGTHEQMLKIEREGKLYQWCQANIKWLQDTFGEENVVSCVLHMDEKTPHLHATVVPIVTTSRKRREREGEAKYQPKQVGPRLCADDVMSRTKLRFYQDSYAKAMERFGLSRGIVASGARHQSQQQYRRKQVLEIETEISKLQSKKTEIERSARDGKNRLLSWIGAGELPKLEKELAEKEHQIMALNKKIGELQKQLESLKSALVRERNQFQKEIETATKRADEWERKCASLYERNRELHRLAYPERYKLSSGAELIGWSIPNRLHPNLIIETLFGGQQHRTTSYNVPPSLLRQYDQEELTMHELVNILFEPEEQVEESQRHLLCELMQMASGGTATPHVGTGGGGSSDTPWNDRDKESRNKHKGRR